MTAVSLTPTGPFSLAAAIRFLEGFTPASHPRATDGSLRLALPADDGTSVIAAAVRQEARADGTPGTVRAELTGRPLPRPGR
ncbi:hypothetical protein [Kitasatospora sp. NPDC056531]|uniref:hypothetical protein n=1 Tax=Kitasatospora sp. NPDC056531 TaxID=3345856 RepID=UPI00368D0D88